MDTFGYLKNLYSRLNKEEEEKYKTIEVPEEEELVEEVQENSLIEELIRSKDELISHLRRENEEFREKFAELRNLGSNTDPKTIINRYVPFGHLRNIVEEEYRRKKAELSNQKKEVQK